MDTKRQWDLVRAILAALFTIKNRIAMDEVEGGTWGYNFEEHMDIKKLKLIYLASGAVPLSGERLALDR